MIQFFLQQPMIQIFFNSYRVINISNKEEPQHTFEMEKYLSSFETDLKKYFEYFLDTTFECQTLPRDNHLRRATNNILGTYISEHYF